MFTDDINAITFKLVKYTNSMDVLKTLTSINPKFVDDVPFKDQIIQVYIYDVYDGDTVKFLTLFGDVIVKLSLRILGIDTPEIRAGARHLASEKNAGIIARDRLEKLINPSKEKHLTNVILRDWDKFGGRVLGDIILENGESVADILLQEGYAKPYHGEKKDSWTLEELSTSPFNIHKN